MCNLSQGIKEDVLAKGKSLSQIADECEETEERIQELMKKL